jgi:hypothetical protein
LYIAGLPGEPWQTMPLQEVCKIGVISHALGALPPPEDEAPPLEAPPVEDAPPFAGLVVDDESTLEAPPTTEPVPGFGAPPEAFTDAELPPALSELAELLLEQAMHVTI